MSDLKVGEVIVVEQAAETGAGDGAGPEAESAAGAAPSSEGQGAHAEHGSRRATVKRVGVIFGRAARGAAHGTREVIRSNPTANTVYRTGVGVVGGGTVAVGVALIPLPGPGALVALGGLGILSTEFDSAKRVSTKANAAAKEAVLVVKDLRDRRKAARAE